MTKLLIARSMGLPKCGSENAIKLSIAAFLSEVLDYTVTVEQPWQRLSWLDYDAVYCYFTEFTGSESHQHLLLQLRQSIAAGQPRLTHWDDEYFMPPSLLKQLGLPDADEFTHVLMLNPQLKPSPQLHKWMDTYLSTSIAEAIRLYCPMYSRALTSGTGHSDASKLMYGATYFGSPKPDRADYADAFPSIEYFKTDYLSYLAFTAKSVGTVILNSVSHMGEMTMRFHETAQLTAQLWPESINVSYHSPKFTFSSDAELQSLVLKLKLQTCDERANLLMEQQECVQKTATIHEQIFLQNQKHHLWP